MSNSSFCFVQSRTKPYFSVHLVKSSDQTDIDLTGSTVTFNFRHIDNPTAVVSGGTCSVTAASTGRVEYRWGANDLAVPGNYVAEFVITYTDNTTQSIIIEDVQVSEKLA